MAQYALRRAELRWHVRATPGLVAAALAEEIASQARQALERRGSYSIVLSGGSTPRPLYGILRGLTTDWARWHIYFSDERCVPRDDPRRNDALVRSLWLDHVDIRKQHIHSIPAELGAEAAAAAYAQAVHSVDLFDTTLLGLGEDGHTASLFPNDGRGIEPDAPDALAVRQAPKPPRERVSLSAGRLSSSRSVVMLATGEGKSGAVAALYDKAAIPAAAIVPSVGVDVWLDSAAAAAVRARLPAD